MARRAVREGLRGAEVTGDLVPRVLLGVTARQMEHEAPDGADDLHADGQQGLAQARGLGVAQGGAIGGQLQRLQEHHAAALSSTRS